MNKYFAFARMMADPGTWRWLIRWLEFSYAHHVTAIARLAQVGPGSWIEPSVKFTNPQNITIGSHCHINHMGCVQADRHSRITIGDHLRMGPGTGIFSSNHASAKSGLIREQPMVEGDVVIGNDVWLGSNVVVTAGVTIGEGAVIAAGAVVTRDIPPYAVAGGVPARVLRYRV